jgi:superfamily II DNA or RNA helicase
MIKLTVDNCTTQIEGVEDLGIVDRISNSLSYKLASAQYSWQAKQTGWDGKVRLLTSQNRFPTGCLDTVCKTLQRYKLDYEICDERKWLVPENPIKWTGPTPYPYQIDMVESCLKNKHGMVRAATGAGKTLTIAKLVGEYNTSTVIYVVSLDLLEQMKEELEDCLDTPIGVVGNGECRIEKITVCSVWTAARAFERKKPKAIKRTFEESDIDTWSPSETQKHLIASMVKDAKLVIMDEAHFAAADSIKFVLSNSVSSANRFGFTATPWRTEGDDLLLEAAFGKIIHVIDSSWLIDNEYLVPPIIYFRDVPPLTDNVSKVWPKVKSKYIVENAERNKLLIDQVIKLLENGRKPLVLFREHKHGEILKSLLPGNIRYRYITGKKTKAERKEIRKEWEEGKLDLLLASTIFDQGINLPTLDALVVADPGKSTSKALQRIGRVIRSHKSSGKRNAIIVEFFDQCHYVDKHSYTRYLIYKTENRFKIKLGKEFAAYIAKKERYAKGNKTYG